MLISKGALTASVVSVLRNRTYVNQARFSLSETEMSSDMIKKLLITFRNASLSDSGWLVNQLPIKYEHQELYKERPFNFLHDKAYCNPLDMLSLKLKSIKFYLILTEIREKSAFSFSKAEINEVEIRLWWQFIEIIMRNASGNYILL